MIDAPGAGALHPLMLYVRIALLKAGPDDLPVSRALLPFTVAGYVLVGLLLGSLVSEGGEGGVLLVALDTAFTLAWYWVVLTLAQRPERFNQTAAAVFGFQTVASPLAVAAATLFRRFGDDPTWQLPVAVLIMAAGIWVLVVNVRILRAATEWSLPVCAALVFSLALLSQLLALSLQPGGAAT